MCTEAAAAFLRGLSMTLSLPERLAIDPLLLPCGRLLRGRLLLVLITNLVKPDIHDISVEFRLRRHREAQSLLDIDELDMGLAWRNGYRNPLEFGHDGLGLRTLAHHRIAQGDLDLPRTAHRSEYHAALDADLDDHDGAVHRAFAGGLAEGKLVAQVAGGGVGGLGRNIHG